MNDDNICEEDHPEMTGEQNVYRAARSASWLNLEAGKLEPTAYKLNLDKQEKALSVGPADHCTAEQYSDPAICGLKVHGIALHKVADIGNLSLVVKQDEPFHAGICGLPDTEGAQQQAHIIAVELSRQSTLVWTRPKK